MLSLAPCVNGNLRLTSCWQSIPAIASQMAFLIDVSKEGGQRIKIVGGIRIELVIMTLRTSDRCSHPDGRQVTNPIRLIHRQVLFRLHAAFMRCLQESVVAGGDFLVLSRIRKQIASQLFASKLVERNV